MHIVFRNALKNMLVSSALSALVLSAQPVFADDHLPIIDFTPTVGWALTSDGGDPPPSATNAEAESGLLTFNGTATLPILKNLSISYDQTGNGAFDSALSPFYINGVPLGPHNPIYPGSSRDLIRNYRADYHLHRFNIEAGFGSRYRQCCPASSLDWHKAFLGISYVTPHFNFLNHGFFVIDFTANGVNHQSTAYYRSVLDSPPPIGGGPNFDIPDGKVFTTTQSVTAIVPVNLHTGIRTATTFVWGALDYPDQGPFPQMYNLFITSVTKQVTNEFGLTATIAHVQQRLQGYPFPSPNSINSSALTIAADFHLDFNHILGKTPPVSQGRPTQPGTPGGPGGPAPISPSQGGAVTPAPIASPAPGMMVPAPSPTPS